VGLFILRGLRVNRELEKKPEWPQKTQKDTKNERSGVQPIGDAPS
jgi:hypothetical protein